MKTPTTPQGLPPYIYGWEAGPNEKVWNEAAVREALAAQAASVEPVAYRVDWPVKAGFGLPRFFGADDRERMDNWVRDRECTVHPLVYASAPPSPASVPADVPSAMTVVCKALQDDPEYAWSWHCNIAMSAFDEGIGHYAANKAAARFLDLLAGVDTTKHPGFPPQHPTPSPEQAVMQVGCENIDGTLNTHPETETCSICEPATAVDAAALLQEAHGQLRHLIDDLSVCVDDDGLTRYVPRDAVSLTYSNLIGALIPLAEGIRAALQTSRQTATQQGGGENTARAFIEWCKAQPEDRAPVSIDEALNEFEAALATKEPK